VAFVGGCFDALICLEALALEDVTEMSTTGCTGDFCTDHEMSAIFMSIDGAGYGIEESRPSTPAAKLRGALVQRRPATCATVHSGVFRVLIFTGSSCLGALLPQDPELGGRKDGTPFFVRFDNRVVRD